MKLILKLFLAMLLLPFGLFAQTYDAYIVEANALYQQKDYVGSCKKWKAAFHVHSAFAGDYYNAACTFALAGEESAALEYLEKAIQAGWDDLDWIQKDTDLAILHNSKKWTDFLQKAPELKANYLQKLNIGLKNKLENLRMQDQVIRLLLPDAEKRFGRESDEYQWFRQELMVRNDERVLAEMITIIDQHGWVGIPEVGELANQTLWMLLQHAPLDAQEKYLPLLEASVEKGTSKASYLAFLKDRILMRNQEKQIYGSQSLWDSKLKKNVIWPVENPSKLNELRKEVGLESIEDYAERNGFLYLPDSKK